MAKPETLKWTGPSELDEKLCEAGLSFDDIEKADCGCPNAKRKIKKVLVKIGENTAENRSTYSID